MLVWDLGEFGLLGVGFSVLGKFGGLVLTVGCLVCIVWLRYFGDLMFGLPCGGLMFCPELRGFVLV